MLFFSLCRYPMSQKDCIILTSNAKSYSVLNCIVTASFCEVEAKLEVDEAAKYPLTLKLKKDEASEDNGKGTYSSSEF